MSDFVEQPFVDRTRKYDFVDLMPVLKGKFTVSDATVPYLQANLDIIAAAKLLMMSEDIPDEHRHSWTLDELFQRDIDWNRVKEDIVKKYLKDRDKTVFFNALTIALLPQTDSGDIDHSYIDMSYSFPNVSPFIDEGYNDIKIGGIRLAEYSRGISYLTWDESRVFPVAIDGQHRLAAIKKLVEGNLSGAQRETTIPVIFLILDKKFGFIESKETDQSKSENPLLISVREIFIHLNKHAKKVTKAREILLDDNEIESRCTRELIERKSLEESEVRLPLGLVNWKDDVAKFDSGPYLTSILSLYASITDCLKIYKPKDPTNQDHVKKLVKSVNNTLFIDRSDFPAGDNANRYPNITFKNYVERNFEEGGAEDPITSLPKRFIPKAIDSFNMLYRPIFIGVFKRFKPYAEFHDLSDENGGISGEYAAYNALPDHTHSDVSQTEQNQFKEIESILVSYKKDRWPFLVVWQKALFRASFDAFDKYHNDDVNDFLTCWLDYLDSLWDLGLLITDVLLDESNSSEGQLWEGICKTPQTRTISYAGAAVAKTHKLIMFWWFYYLGRKNNTVTNDFVGLLLNGESNENFPNGQKYCSDLIAAMGDVIKVRKDISNEEAIQPLARQRLENILYRYDRDERPRAQG